MYNCSRCGKEFKRQPAVLAGNFKYCRKCKNSEEATSRVLRHEYINNYNMSSPQIDYHIGTRQSYSGYITYCATNVDRYNQSDNPMYASIDDMPYEYITRAGDSIGDLLRDTNMPTMLTICGIDYRVTPVRVQVYDEPDSYWSNSDFTPTMNTRVVDEFRLTRLDQEPTAESFYFEED
jgi:hypothetical protein